MQPLEVPGNKNTAGGEI